MTTAPLADLFPEVTERYRNQLISGLTLDSRQIQPGDLFCACRGLQEHGAEFVADAVRRGAVAVALDDDGGEQVRVAQQNAEHRGFPHVCVDDLAQRLSEVAGRFYADPSQRMTLVGITGTNGKTSTAWLLAWAFAHLGYPAAYTGTLGVHRMIPGAAESESFGEGSSLTTADAITLQQNLAQLRCAGVTHGALELSSHALDQGRALAVHCAVGVFTNLSRDHLDYHGSEAAYLQAKSKLFELPGLKVAVINIDDRAGKVLAQQLRERGKLSILSFGTSDSADVRFQSEVLSDSSSARQKITVQSPWGRTSFRLPLPGEFNAYNACAALVAMCACGESIDAAAAALQSSPTIPGRMEQFNHADCPLVIVDFAHTPDALQRVLQTLRVDTEGELWCVFGCGGDRDRGKRREMGRIAGREADQVVVTSDNPRSEPPQQIAADIVAGLPSSQQFQIQVDRERAIAFAIDSAAANDTVLIAGKGHEQTQHIGDVKQHFDDREISARYLQLRLARVARGVC